MLEGVIRLVASKMVGIRGEGGLSMTEVKKEVAEKVDPQNDESSRDGFA